MLRYPCGWVLLTIVCFAPTGAEATKFWKNSVTSGNWGTGSNWSAVSAAGADNGGAPSPFEATRIVHTDGVARTVTLNVTPATLGLVAIDLTGGGTAADTLAIDTANNLTSSGLFVGGHNGVATTNGRGAVTQSAGAVATAAGSDLVIGHGAGSTGVYTLSGGSLTAPQSIFLGFSGAGTFNHSGGTVTVNPGAIGSFNIGTVLGATGQYNLSGAGQVTSNKSVFLGDQGVGTFTQTGGTHTIAGANDLVLAFGATGNGAYIISGGTLSVNDDVVVGNSGSAIFNISGTANVSVGNNLAINGTSVVNLNGGTLRLNTATGINRVNYSAGTVRLAGSRRLSSGPTADPIIATLFDATVDGAAVFIPVGRALEVEQVVDLVGTTRVSGGTLRSLSNGAAVGDFRVGENGAGSLEITSGGLVTGSIFQIGSGATASSPFQGTVTVSGSGSTLGTTTLKVGGKGAGSMEIAGGASVSSASFASVGGTNSSEPGTGVVTLREADSTWTANSLSVGAFGSGVLSLETGTTVDVATAMNVGTLGAVNVKGGTLKFAMLTGGERVNFISGTIHAYGAHTLGTDPSLTPLFGVTPVIAGGRNLTIGGLATLDTRTTIDGGVLTVGSLNSGGTVDIPGGRLDFVRGMLKITNQVVDVTASGPLGNIIDLNDDAILEVTQGMNNFGLVTGDGEIRATLTNFGQLRADPGKSLRLTAPATNSGRINLVGGLLDFDQTLSNQSGGLISGNGSLAARSGITNQGTMNFAGTANVLGDVTNSAGGKIISGGGGATVFFDDVANQGEIRTSTNGFTVFFGSVSGAGTFTGTGTVNFEGDLTPGNSPATLSFGGDVTFGAGAAVQIEIGGAASGSGYDQLLVADSLTLDGALEVSLINGFQPALGQSFNLLDWGTLVGEFSSLSLPSLASGLAWDTSQLYSTGALSVAAAGLSGDYNNDGQVNAADYTVWRDGGPLQNETASIGVVDSADYAAWSANYGATAGSLGVAVPEPGAAFLLGALGLLVLDGRRLASDGR